MSAFETFEICLKSETSLVSFLPTTLFTPARDLHRKRVPKLPNPIQPKLVLDLFPSQSVCKHLRKVAIRCSLNLVFLMQVTVTVLVANGGFGLMVLRFSPFRPANSSFEFPATLSENTSSPSPRVLWLSYPKMVGENNVLTGDTSFSTVSLWSWRLEPEGDAKRVCPRWIHECDQECDQHPRQVIVHASRPVTSECPSRSRPLPQCPDP